jgi:hypothetical protein
VRGRGLVAGWVTCVFACGGDARPPELGGSALGESDSDGGASSTAGNNAAGSGAEAGSPGSGGASAQIPGTSPGGGTMGTNGFSLAAQMYDSVTGNPMQGVSMCLLNSPSTCVTTVADGSFAIQGVLPTGSGITGTMSGYVVGVWPAAPTANVSGWSLNMRSTTRMAALAMQVGAEFGTTGAIYFQVTDGNKDALAGVSVSTSVGGKPAYFAGDGTGLSGTLTQSTSAGNGYVFELPAGTVDVRFSAAGRACARSGAIGWPPADGTETTSMPIVAGQVSSVWAVCQ